ncbi:MAG: MATE family efflux transporter [Planctomycetes bacterium]|nr:MATE family efflux transporter [Planctomycetota bacterium]
MSEPALSHEPAATDGAIPTDAPEHAGSLRELLRIAVPLIISSGSVSVMHLANRMFLTRYSLDAVAAVLPSGILHWTIISLIFGTVQYANTFVAQYEGAGRRDRVAAAVWQAIYLAVGGGVLVNLIALQAGPMFAAIGHEPAIAKLEGEYFGTLCFSSVPMLLTAAMTCFFSGRGQTRVVMAVNVIGVSVNVLCDYLLIFGNGPIPSLGIRGAGISTVVAQTVECVMLAWLFFDPSQRAAYGTTSNRAFDRELFRRFVTFGFPQGMHFFLDVASFAVFMQFIGRLGKTELAATNLAFNLNTLAFIPMLGLGTAVSTLVGNRIGEGRPELAVRTTWTAFKLSAAYMLTFAAIYVLLPDLILRPYFADSAEANSAAVRDTVVLLLRFVAVYCFFDAMGIVFGFAIRGAGDTRFALVFSCLTAWSLMVMPTAVSVTWYGGGLRSSWWFCTIYIIVLGLGFFARFLAGHWKSMKVIEAVRGEDM